MKVVTLRTDDCGVSWYRMRLPVAAMSDQDLVELRTTPNMMPFKLLARDGGTNEQQEMAHARKMYQVLMDGADILHTQRAAHYEVLGIFQALAWGNGVPWVIDIDDNILTLDPANPAYGTYRERDTDECYEQRPIAMAAHCHDDELCVIDKATGGMRAVKQKQVDFRSLSIEQLKLCDAMFVTTHALRDLYANMIRREMGKQALIYVLPNSIDFEVWGAVKPPPPHDPEVWVGWAGSASHAADIDLIAPVMDEILRTHPQVHFFWQKLESPRLLKLMEKYPGRATLLDGWVGVESWQEYYTAMNFDIALGPLHDTEFNRGKSNLKWLEAGMLRQPFVASRVGPYADTITHKKDGLLANRTSSWIKAIESLVTSRQLREDIGNRAYERVRAEYNIRDNAHLWVKAYEDIQNRLGDRCRQRTERITSGGPVEKKEILVP